MAKAEKRDPLNQKEFLGISKDIGHSLHEASFDTEQEVYERALKKLEKVDWTKLKSKKAREAHLSAFN